MDTNFSINEKIYGISLQNNIKKRATSHITFKGNHLQGFQNQLCKQAKTNTIVRNMAETIKLFLQKTFCKPTKTTLLNMGDDINTMFNFCHYDIDNKKIDTIFRILDTHSKNAELSDFVKDGIGFLKRVKRSENKEGTLRKFYTGTGYDTEKIHGTVPVADENGHYLITTIQSALVKAVRPNVKINDEKLQKGIKFSRRYMAEFEK